MSWIERYWRDRRGTISPLMVMALIPIVGAMAMGTEEANWWLVQRQAQNAADSAAIAAANAGSVNGVASCGGTEDYCSEAKAVASKYGFTDGSNNTTISVLDNQTCPSPLSSTDCFKVTITHTVPVTLLSVVGFTGNNGDGTQTIKASAMAWPTGGATANTTNFCIIALGTAATKDLTFNGAPRSNLPGCAIGSNGGTICKGQGIPGLVASYAAPGDQDTCDQTSADNVPLRSPITDPYSSLASNIPANSCTSYSTESKQGRISQLAAANQLSGTISGTKIVCGDAGLAGNVTLASGAILEVVDGWVDLGSYNLTGTGANGSTIIFTGNASPGFTPNPPMVTGGNGSNWTTNDATSGTWAGFAVYTDPSLTDVPASSFKIGGNSGPSIVVNGLWYSPNASITLDGCIGGGACNGSSPSQCLGFLTYNFTIDGNGDLINQPNCTLASLNGGNEGFLAGVVELVQ